MNFGIIILKLSMFFGIYVIYIIFKLNGFSRNLRTELKRAKKFYFYDNGIRNAILQNFAPLALRQDVGALWENFFISERMKANQNAGRYVNSYFWRTSQQQWLEALPIGNSHLGGMVYGGTTDENIQLNEETFFTLMVAVIFQSSLLTSWLLSFKSPYSKVV